MFMSLDEMTQVLAAAKKLSPSLYMFQSLLGFAGLRPSEALSLKVSDVFYLGHIVTEIHLAPTNTKTRSGRDVPVPLPLKAAISHFLGEIGKTTPHDSWLLEGPLGKPFTIRAMQYSTRKLGFAVLHRIITPKTFRHTYATLLARVAPIRSVQAALGHASLQSTQVYTHPVADDLQNAVHRLFDRVPSQDVPLPFAPTQYPEGKD